MSTRLILLLLVLAAGGCAHNYTPETKTYPFPPIIEFTSTKAISITNVQTSSNAVLFGNAGIGHEWYGSLRGWTDVAVDLATREITKRGMSIQAGAPKSLTLSVTEIKSTTGGFGFRGFVDLEAVTGDGYRQKYNGDSPSALITRAADGAVMQAVATMLKDPKITEYLTK